MGAELAEIGALMRKHLRAIVRKFLRTCHRYYTVGVMGYVLAPLLAACERELLASILDEHGGNVSHVARELGISRKGLQLKMIALGIRAQRLRALAAMAPSLSSAASEPAAVDGARWVRLSGDGFALVDADMHAALVVLRWRRTTDGYAIGSQGIFMHHLIIGKPRTGLVTDHKNRNRLDNRRENLRHVTPHENWENSPSGDTHARSVRNRSDTAK